MNTTSSNCVSLVPDFAEGRTKIVMGRQCVGSRFGESAVPPSIYGEESLMASERGGAATAPTADPPPPGPVPDFRMAEQWPAALDLGRSADARRFLLAGQRPRPFLFAGAAEPTGRRCI